MEDVSSMDTSEKSQISIFELLSVLDNLKHLKRAGWVRFKVPEPETVASHMYRMAVLAFALKGEPGMQVDCTRCLLMSLIHDIGEAIIGDLTPHCGVSDTEKHSREKKALEYISSLVPSVTGQEWMALWSEYEEAETPEAKVVKQLDKFDMIVQAFDYEKTYGIDLSQFFDSTTLCFSTRPFVEWNRELREKREAWHASKKESSEVQMTSLS